jgi:hypothetical protein
MRQKRNNSLMESMKKVMELAMGLVDEEGDFGYNAPRGKG